ncbi:MAG TPA: DUF1761 domain-containing protein [Thermoanaerobaculia bacterium]|nr:DUF1761 domain-containing protein [Thermoanaerobaculia bacterium]
MQLPQVNYLAVLVSAVVIFFLGGLWYSKALFAKKWMALMGKTEEEIKAAGAPPMGLMLLQGFISGLLVAWTLAVILNHFANLTALRGALVGGLCWLGFAGATSYSTALFSMQKKQLWVINTGFNLVSFVIAGVILACWR